MDSFNEFKSPYPDNIEFTRYWEMYVGDVTERENFKVGHLEQLRILCQLYTEFDKLTNIISENGYTYLTETRNGTQSKVFSEVSIRKETLMEIRMYSKMLGLILEKDMQKNKREEIDDWQ